MKTERETSQTPNVRRTQLLWVGAVLAVASAVAIAWMGVPFMTKRDALSNPLPPARAAAPVEDAVGARLSSAEEKLNEWLKERVRMTDRMTQMEKSLSAGIRRARTETLALVEGVKREMGRSLETVQSRMTGIESIQRETHDEVAYLRGELATVRRDMDAIREASAQQANQVRQVELARQSTQNDVSGLQNEMASNQRKIDALSYHVERQNVGFEVSKDRTEQVVPGIYLTIHRTDVGRQQVDGWLQIASDGRFVPLHDTGAQQVIRFSSRKDERAYELVFTRIAEGSVAGYVLVPAMPASTETAAK